MGQHLEEAEVLLVRADSEGAVVVLSANRKELFRRVVNERFALEDFSGDGALDVEWELYGLDAEGFRAALPRLDERERQQWALGGYEKRYPGLQCWRRFKSDQACRLNFDQGPAPGFLMPGCG